MRRYYFLVKILLNLINFNTRIFDTIAGVKYGRYEINFGFKKANFC